ncbi:MAG TPA: hypothetical protein VIF02_07880 [Methylocella sp.]
MTSLPPSMGRRIQGVEFGSVWQAACIDSWKAERFHVVSLNTSDEIAALETFASRVDFVEMPASHQRPLITDFFDAIAKSSYELAGIINADCLLIPGNKLGERLAGSVDGLVMAERLNISQTTMRPTGRHCFGFDAFFFKTASLAAAERDDSWRIGDTWWDYWFPLSLHLAGVKLKTLPAPILAHLDHDRAWSEQSWKENGQRLNKFLRARTRGFRHRKLAAFVKEPLETEADIPKLGFNIFHWLRSHEPLWCPEAGSMDDLLTRFFLSLSMPPPETIQCPVPVEPTPSSRLRNALGFFKRSK